jgi:membrane protease YdiL (CAAX protease family)
MPVTVKNHISSFKYVIGLSVLLLVLFKISYFIEDVFIPNDSFSAGIASIISQLVAFSIVIGVGLKKQRKTLASVCVFKKVSGGVWGAIIICSIGFTLFSFYINELFYSFMYGWNMNYDEPEGNFLINLIDTATIPAIAEELLIKGLVFIILKKYYSTIVSVIIASLMFAVLHLTPIRIIPLFLFSFYTFWVYLRSGSLIMPMFLHFIHNLFTFVLISEPFASLGTFYAGLILFAAGSYMLHRQKKQELVNLAKQKDMRKVTDKACP